MIRRIILSAIIISVSVSIKPLTVNPLATATPYSKVGIHSIRPNNVVPFTQFAAAGKVHFSVVKAVDDLGHLATVKAISPNTVIVARLTSAHESAHLVNDPTTNLEWYAGIIMNPIFNKLDQTPGLGDIVDYWEPVNEPLGGGTPSATYERLAQLMIYCMDLAEANEIKLALFSFNAGTPEWVDMVVIAETGIFARALAGDHILALHEGVFGIDDPIDLWYGYPIPGAPEVPDAGPLSCRYRFWYHLLKQRNEVIPLFVSEFYAGGGYGDDADIDDIVGRMAWYDKQLRRDDYALGFGPFTVGPTPRWTKQNYEFVYPALIEYMIDLRRESLPIKTYIPIMEKRSG